MKTKYYIILWIVSIILTVFGTLYVSNTYTNKLIEQEKNKRDILEISIIKTNTKRNILKQEKSLLQKELDSIINARQFLKTEFIVLQDENIKYMDSIVNLSDSSAIRFFSKETLQGN